MSYSRERLRTHAYHAAGIAQSIGAELAKVANLEHDRAAMLQCRSAVLACITNAIRQLTKAERYLDAFVPPADDEDLSAPRYDADPDEAA